MEWLVVGVVVEDGLVKMVREWLPLFLGVGVEAEVEKIKILLFASRKCRFFSQITLQEPLMSFWEGEE